jgi:glycerol-3-phosphate dehydrogenase
VWGGKITTFRKLAEEAADLLAAPLKVSRGPWTAGASLPGGDLRGWSQSSAPGHADVVGDFARFVLDLAQRHPAIPPAVCQRLARCYGSRVERLIGHDGLGREVVNGLFEAELNYLHEHEWARTADDVLWRRTKLGLHMNAAQRSTVAAWCQVHWSSEEIACN